ncbi:hypothetical protein [Natrarchaeobaculum aegyptiacum]|uniref:Uncharacterized protein n=1 Tax=Natrarchaeobaculum aegyptiacum TaxID=745377 RepID=A0A2Z2HZB9_9EURY|nr:hypothetical protein [Natrarchaeobaculum aegyptiacum]ARS90494.1 hypothetical protein B1756_12665 [Natrarchaeobaculum aegyptiacum]
MPARRSLPLVELFRTAPAKSFLLTVGPLALALGQLANAALTDFSPILAVGFAAVMVAFAVVATRHHAAEVRLERLEGSLSWDDATPTAGELSD